MAETHKRQLAPKTKKPSKAVAAIHKDAILDEVRKGRILREIAQDYGVSGQALHLYLKDLPEYQEAKQTQAASMIEEAKTETWAAREQLEIARAREISRFAFRYAESVDPDRWGQKREITVRTDDLGERLRRAKERVIEHEPAQDVVAGGAMLLDQSDDAV